MNTFKDQTSEYFRTITVANKEFECWDIAAAFKAFFISTNFEINNPTDLNCQEKIDWFSSQPKGWELMSRMQASRKQGCKATKVSYWLDWLSLDTDKNYDPISKVLESDTSHLADLCQAEGSFPRRNG